MAVLAWRRLQDRKPGAHRCVFERILELHAAQPSWVLWSGLRPSLRPASQAYDVRACMSGMRDCTWSEG